MGSCECGMLCVFNNLCNKMRLCEVVILGADDGAVVFFLGMGGWRWFLRGSVTCYRVCFV